MDWPWKHGESDDKNLLKAGFEVVVSQSQRQGKGINRISATSAASSRTKN
jgi:hypothetical protein